MRQNARRSVGIWTAGAVALVLLGAGPAKKGMPDLRKETLPKVDETVGDIAFVRANDNIKVEGVGLVIGLDGTGSDPEPSMWRTKLLDRMRKAQVPNAEKWLESPTTSLVLVRGTIPAGVSEQDRWDVELELTPASTTTSLAGGYLMLTPMNVVQVLDGQSLDGQVMAEGFGPVLIDSAAGAGGPKKARVLGGARAKKDLPYTMVLKESRQGYRTADLLQKVVNLRFHQRKGIDQVGMATAKSPQYLVLNVPRVYHHNQFRYFQIIERLPMVDTPELRARRQDQWTKELLDPKTAGQAALRLEGIGRNASGALKQGLESADPQVRFFAAEALAYLGDPAGVDVLAEAATGRPEFRPFALAAMAAMDDSASALRLRALMNQPDPSLRYGAFNALRTMDEHDPFLGRIAVLHEPKADEPPDDATALKLHSAPRRSRPRPEDPFALYVVDCEGPPMVHIARTRRCEVVLFGRDQRLLLPVVLGGTGPILLNATANDREVQVSRIGASGAGLPDVKVACRPELAEIIRSIADLGGTYPDVLAVLQMAERQKNLEGPVVVDAVPSATDLYDAAQLAGVDAAKAKAAQDAAKADPAVGRASAPGASAKAAEGPSRPRLLDRLRLRRRDDR
jgi:flagellar basal body P-ring protein FlgI